MGVATKVIIAGAVILVFGALYYFTQEDTTTAEETVMQEGASHSVVLTDSGYEPKTLSIKKGDVVVFTTDRGFEHWPASNLHPTHNLYSAFDPKRPLGASEEWSFQFMRVGEWEFHDHLNSTFTGAITVTE